MRHYLHTIIRTEVVLLCQNPKRIGMRSSRLLLRNGRGISTSSKAYEFGDEHECNWNVWQKEAGVKFALGNDERLLEFHHKAWEIAGGSQAAIPYMKQLF